MKTLPFILLVGILLPARADNLLKNADFTQGTIAWRGDLKKVQVENGLILPLKLNDFIFIAQPFRSGSKSVTATITYDVSSDYDVPDWSRAADTIRASRTIGIAPSTLARALLLTVDQPFFARPNAWLVLVVDSNQTAVGYTTFVPEIGKAGMQTATVTLSHLMRYENKVFYLFLPPARGTAMIQKIVLKANGK